MNLPSPFQHAAVAAEQSVEMEVQVVNRLGLHARPAADLVRCARQFRSDIEFRVHGSRHSAKRVIDVLLAGLNHGARFTIVAHGPDAQVAVESLASYVRHLGDLDIAEEEEVRANRLQRFDLEDAE